MIDYLKKNPGQIGVIGEKLLNQESEKKSNGEKSEIFELLEKQGKCRLYKDSSDTTRNNEYLMLEHLKINPGEVGVIGEELLYKKKEDSEAAQILKEKKKDSKNNQRDRNFFKFNNNNT